MVVAAAVAAGVPVLVVIVVGFERRRDFPDFFPSELPPRLDLPQFRRLWYLGAPLVDFFGGLIPMVSADPILF